MPQNDNTGHGDSVDNSCVKQLGVKDSDEMCSPPKKNATDGLQCVRCPVASTNHDFTGGQAVESDSVMKDDIAPFGLSCGVQCVHCPGPSGTSNFSSLDASDFIDDEAVETNGGVLDGDNDDEFLVLEETETDGQPQVDLQVDLETEDSVDCFCHNCMRCQVCNLIVLSY